MRQNRVLTHPLESLLYDAEKLKHNVQVLCKDKQLKEFKLQFAHVINEVSKTTQLTWYNPELTESTAFSPSVRVGICRLSHLRVFWLYSKYSEEPTRCISI